MFARAANTQLSPVRIAPRDSSARGPNRSIKKPCHGDRKVCRTIRSENVTWTWARLTPKESVRGFVNRAHTYCGLEIATMQRSPSTSWIHRLPRLPVSNSPEGRVPHFSAIGIPSLRSNAVKWDNVLTTLDSDVTLPLCSVRSAFG